MACYAPITAWRGAKTNKVYLGYDKPDSATPLQLPCGKCIGCDQAQARAWALRCYLESNDHLHSAFTTLTYADENLPITLTKRHLQLFLKRLRRTTTRTIRFFASGEYGETTGRPHYHAILYGLHHTEAHTIDAAWGLGHSQTYPVTPARIAYVAGYTNKKADWRNRAKEERIDPTTGEIYTWQPPFIQMSRGGRNGHGIGGSARQWPESWRSYAILNGNKQPVPRYLHQAWLDQATDDDKKKLQDEKLKTLIEILADTTPQKREAAYQIALARKREAAAKRNQL